MKDKILQSVSENIEIYGIKKLNLDLICKDLKISKKTIYKYFKNKDEIIKEYIRIILETDRESTMNIINEDISLKEKCNNIIYTYHKYKLPFIIMDEIQLYYKEEWNSINELKKFKISEICSLLEEAKKKGEIREDIDISIVSLIIDEVSEKLLDNKTLKANNLKLNDVMNQVIEIILLGIIK